MAECWGEERCTFLDYQLPHRRYTIPQRLRLRLAKALGRQHVVPYGIDDWRCNLLVRDLRKLADRIKPSCVLVEYVFYSHLFDCFDRSVLKVLDTHDIVAGRPAVPLKQGREPEWFYTTRSQEAIGINRADYIVAIRETERSYFLGLTRKPVCTVGHMVKLMAPAAPSNKRTNSRFRGLRKPSESRRTSILAGRDMAGPYGFPFLVPALRCLEVFVHGKRHGRRELVWQERRPRFQAYTKGRG